MEVLEITVRTNSNYDQNKSKTGEKTILNIARVCRFLMANRRIYEIYSGVINEIRKQIYNLSNNESKNAMELLEQLIKRYSDSDDSYLVLTLKHIQQEMTSVVPISQPRKSRLSLFRKMSSISSLNMANAYQKDIRIDNNKDIDKYIYDVVPDDEEIEKIFT
jgi:hypothetical protein